MNETNRRDKRGRAKGMKTEEGNRANSQIRETVLITGATGFLGEYLVRSMASGYNVLAMGRDREKGRLLEKLGAKFCPGDFTDPNSCAAYFKGVHYVIHAGALSTVWGKWEDFYKTNVQGTSIVAGLCLEHNVKRLVYLSSPSIYTGKQDQYNIKEEESPETNELNFYIKSKLMAERVIRQWNRKGLETVILRPRGLIGIGDASLVPRLLRANAHIGIPLMRGGHNVIDLTSVENAALACRLALSAKGVNGMAFNITNGEPMEFKALLELFLAAIGKRPHYIKLPFRLLYGVSAGLEWIYRKLGCSLEPPLTRYTVCTLGFAQTMDISKAKELLGYHPEKSLRESIEEYGRWWIQTEEGRIFDLPEPPGCITGVKLYHCGSCTNSLHLLFRGKGREKRKFPARAALIQHKDRGNILFDTGYSPAILEKRFILKLYRLLNPVQIRQAQTIKEQLQRGGVDPDSIRTIILSHAHPDHIGGLSDFSDYELVASREVLESLKKPRLKNLVFPYLLPERGAIKNKREPKDRLYKHFLCSYFDQVYDLLGDGSIIGVILDGHCKGQLGIWIPDYRLFLATDACWGGDLIRDTGKMRWLPRYIQNNFSEYKKTIKRLCQLKQDYPDIRIVFTHQKKGGKSNG